MKSRVSLNMPAQHISLFNQPFYTRRLDLCHSDLCAYDWINTGIISRYKYHYMNNLYLLSH
jgi:hypothetical protein